MAAAIQPTPVSGHFAPSAPPQAPDRKAFGEHCIVELKQKYALSGDLTGTMEIDFRIYVAGPCGSPPGTFEEHWIAYGMYSVSERAGSLVYLADVEAGGAVSGRLILAGELKGTLRVHGSFEDGRMSYSGNLGGV